MLYSPNSNIVAAVLRNTGIRDHEIWRGCHASVSIENGKIQSIV